MSFNTIPEIIDDIRNGKMVILVDDEDRENEGDLILAADHVTTQAINFMITEARGLVCLTLTAQQIERLQLPLMVRDDLNFAPNKTAFTVSIEAAEGISTGISAADRAHTVKVAANPHAKAVDVHMPGHIFPIRAQQGGVLKRAGHTEASVDLARLAGLNPAAVICEVMNPDGSMARVGDLKEFAKKHNMKIGTIVDLIAYRLANETLVEELSSFDLPASFGEGLKARVFRSTVDGLEHLVIQKGEIMADEETLVRVHVDNFTRDFMAVLQRGASTVVESLRLINESQSGAFVLLRGNNRTSGLTQELQVLMGMDDVRPTTPLMDERDYGIGAQILRSIGANKIRLLTNKPEKKVGLKAFDLEIVEIVAIENVKGQK
ncbi:3,4-dihydroxy-2-butanone-4-phosphate synthase [Bdellovibrio bacteriovorus]|uniref:3,4-dihydroxy-2-butanone 4-phosphate synthase n=1 Tax=Bdellovibrio bacteriovorus TaxID=959 RepID=A0A150WNG4_BDEBC|nr:3,4-dihydroxy-2-butanone-4-phosphate synthase [Bdellovibrio bacteriovorus]KYG65950.1 3,4-dihydroxy-2-butanone-4-phosphate synthase [Bdellovibrio bacteriovorus]